MFCPCSHDVPCLSPIFSWVPASCIPELYKCRRWMDSLIKRLKYKPHAAIRAVRNQYIKDHNSLSDSKVTFHYSY